jgi:hypothetical protein
MQNVINISEKIREKFSGVPVIDRRTALGAVNMDLAQKFHRKLECTTRAQATPLPGESAGAFLHDSINVCGKQIYRFVPAHFMVLQKIESPLLDMIAEAVRSKTAGRDLTMQEQCDLCYIFTNDPETVYLEAKKGGKEAIQSGSERDILLKWEKHEIEFVINGIFEQYVRHVQTKSKILTEEAEKGEVRFFQVPTPEVLIQKASDGSLTT